MTQTEVLNNMQYTEEESLVQRKNHQHNNNNEEKIISSEETKTEKYEKRLIWINILGIILLHILTLIYLTLFPMELYLSFFNPDSALRVGCPKWQTVVFMFLSGALGGFGVTTGAHRLWTHRSFTASWPLRLILIICYSLAGQNRIFDWVRDHRVHHKFSETDADPHNTNRGFFFSHVGWLFVSKHPKVIEKGKLIDMQDILDDPIVSFHTRFFYPCQIFAAGVLPTLIPFFLWKENFIFCLLATATRYTFILNATWSVNSFAHFYGYKPYNREMAPCENIGVALFAFGEGWHNYHHSFPWDYRTSEFGGYRFNLSTYFIDFFAKIGWASDLKTVSNDLVSNLAKKTGDGTYGKSVADMLRKY